MFVVLCLVFDWFGKGVFNFEEKEVDFVIL